MALIREDGVIDWGITKRDKYLRNQEAPALFDDPVTVRDIRAGAEVISRSGNIMPRAITRDKLGEDALLVAMNINVVAADVKQVSTGYDRALNNFLYAVTWDGVNYALRRFNTLDLLSPYQDAFLVDTDFGLLGAEAMGNVFGVAVTNDKVVVSYETDTGNRYIAIYNFDLVFQSRVKADFYELALDRPFNFDGVYLNHLSPGVSGNLINSQQILDNASHDVNSQGTVHQTFKTGANMTVITGFSVLMGSGLATNPTINWAVKSSDGMTTLSSGSFGIDETKQFYDVVGLNISVSPNTTYRLELSHQVGTATENWFGHSQNKYPDGAFSAAAFLDAAFKIRTAAPAGYSGNRVIRYNPADYARVDTFSWPGTPALPSALFAHDKKFQYAYNSTDKKIVKFTISGGAITVASQQAIQEDVKGVLWFNSFLFLVFKVGSSLVSVPTSL